MMHKTLPFAHQELRNASGCRPSGGCGRASGAACRRDLVQDEIYRVFGPRHPAPQEGLCFADGCEPFIWQDALLDDDVDAVLEDYPDHELGFLSLSWDVARTEPCYVWSCYDSLTDRAQHDPETMRWLCSPTARRQRRVPVPHGWLSDELFRDIALHVPFAVTLLPSRLLDLCSRCAATCRSRCCLPFQAEDLLIGQCDPQRDAPSAALEKLAHRALETEILCDWLDTGFDPAMERLGGERCV